MKSFKGLIKRTKSVSSRGGIRNRDSPDFDNAPADSPEANAPRAIRLFCESASTSNGGEEVLHLPVIVESAESSPMAAASAAIQIRKFLSKEWQSKPRVQYNAIMLIRILSDNPGATFTRNFDKSFVTTVKELLRTGKDQSTQQILRETLDALEVNKQYDEGVQPLLAMWRKEKGMGGSLSGGGRMSMSFSRASTQLNRTGFPHPNPQEQQQQHRQDSGNRRRRDGAGLPNAVELASRVEEAKNTAKILLQLVQSTPAEQVLHDELLKEFNDRCQSAQKSMQSYINADHPSPDHDTMHTLIETNEQLSLATSRYQRAVLAARRALGQSPTPPQQQLNQTTASNGYGAFAPPQQQDTAFTSAPNGYENQNPSSNQAPSQPPTHQRQQPAQTFHIDSEPTFAPQPLPRQNTTDLENAYSPDKPQISPSYVGRQQRAAGHLTMHGAQPEDDDGKMSPEEPKKPTRSH
ncbi:uncharacterized protein MYCFIDRAFT_151285 [Pseudocercospora fijiensis CIRAD86]|uniref:GAT domain-containing protein n=1 Tax=Pseudocercospora fijiensis (strain CIRAD86) TaxID=383855 RepID=M2Z920_PSEFD|nr:uncharacterized protein MYCFIDRAFT_151285 [Pseudocercospora fijiensis CIRAD86]EME86265.1 hypothetical protein MYCFIDRAFT_151285 [Pseudocercospora fijiensis CIRAD86]